MASAHHCKNSVDSSEDISDEALTDARREQLKRLLDYLECYDAGSGKREFGEVLLEAQSKLELSDLDLAHMFRVSRPTANRWIRGETAPHPIARKPVIDVLVALTRRRLKSL